MYITIIYYYLFTFEIVCDVCFGTQINEIQFSSSQHYTVVKRFPMILCD